MRGIGGKKLHYMTTKKMIERASNKVAVHKRIFTDYTKFKHLPAAYNKGEIVGNTFTLRRIKDNSIICQFDVNTFEAVK